MAHKTRHITHEQSYKECDIISCSKDADDKCDICEKDLCKEHKILTQKECYQLGDHCSIWRVCPYCYEKGKKYIANILAADEAFYDKMNEEIDKWRRDCEP